jgi:hypothetical protein
MNVYMSQGDKYLLLEMRSYPRISHTTGAEIMAAHTVLPVVNGTCAWCEKQHAPLYSDGLCEMCTDDARPSPSTVTEEGLVPSAYLKLWLDGPADANGCRCRVDLTEICEPWLDALKPTIVPLYTAEDAASGHTALLRTLEVVRKRLVDAADHQCTKRGDYLYKGHPDAWIADSINEIDAALSRGLAEGI